MQIVKYANIGGYIALARNKPLLKMCETRVCKNPQSIKTDIQLSEDMNVFEVIRRKSQAAKQEQFITNTIPTMQDEGSNIILLW